MTEEGSIERRKVLVIFKIPAYVTTPLVSIPGGTEFDLCLIEFYLPFRSLSLSLDYDDPSSYTMSSRKAYSCEHLDHILFFTDSHSRHPMQN